MDVMDREHIDYVVAGHDLRRICNFSEHLVLAAMRGVLEADPEMCRCRLCVEDLYALSLNALPAHYIQCTSFPKFRASGDHVSPEDVRKGVERAALVVKRRPNH
jgi:hypothetical protein